MEREIESERRDCGRDDGDTEEEHHETQGKNGTGNQILYQKQHPLLFVQFPFYRINGEVTCKRRLATLVPRQLTFVQREDETNEIIS